MIRSVYEYGLFHTEYSTPHWKNFIPSQYHLFILLQSVAFWCWYKFRKNTGQRKEKRKGEIKLVPPIVYFKTNYVKSRNCLK